MGRTNHRFLRAALNALHYSGASRLLSPLTKGAGVIFMLHRVDPNEPADFEPNRILSVRPEFLREVIRHVRAEGFDIISMDEVSERLRRGPEQAGERPFAAFTLDDGYRDNIAHAYPVFKSEAAPFTMYVPTSFLDGEGELWWLALERVIRAAPAIVVQMQGELKRFNCPTTATKEATFEAVYWWLRSLPEARAREVVRDLAAGIGLDLNGLCRELIMSWDELKAFAQDPLVTIGAHSITHHAIAGLTEAEARAEIEGSMKVLGAALGRPCLHFSYPYGDPLSAGPREFRIAAEAGALTAVTTRKGVIRAEHGGALTALPRLSLNGDYQRTEFVDVLMSGAPFAALDLVRGLAGPRHPVEA